MHNNDLIAEFASRYDLPIDVNDVVACLKNNGVEGDIEFIGVELNTEILQGLIRKFYGHGATYSDPKLYVNIYYSNRQSLAWQRFVCCKELFHLLDQKVGHTSTPDDIYALAEKIGLPPEMQNPASDSLATNIDRVAEFRAAAILLPMAARELLMPHYKAGTMTIEDIARMADIPRRYAGFVMSSVWTDVHDLLIGLP